MPNTFFGLTIGTSGLFTSMSGINTTSHNISNSETDGYCRQIVEQDATSALRVNSTYGMAGTGVYVKGITQMRNEYYDIKYRDNQALLGEYDNKEHYMTEIENYFNEVKTDGFTTAFSNLQTSLEELEKNPSDLTTRTEVTNYAQSMCEYFNYLSDSLDSVQKEANEEIKNQADRVNAIAEQVAALTKQINTLEVQGGTANDLRDSRNNLIDELSSIANCSVKEETVGDDVGVTSYVVKLDSHTLVDTYSFNTLTAVPSEYSNNQSDIDGLYDLKWSDGADFDNESASLGGTLSALYEVRDGNNGSQFAGDTTVSTGDTKITIKNTDFNDANTLNIPATGVITIGNHEYEYAGFQATQASDGTYSYEFELSSDTPVLADATDATARIGEDISYKGVPYYQAQLNEFVRTYAQEFNDIQTAGEDLYGNKGTDFFNAADNITGSDYVFGQSDAQKTAGIAISSNTGSYLNTDDTNYGNYYLMTAANFKVTDSVLNDPSKVAAASSITDGVENADQAKKMAELENKDIFLQGTPSEYLNSIVAEIGIDSEKAQTFSENQNNICETIENQRLSVSGVDSEEEAMSLIEYQNAYNLSAKAISVMNEIYDKLINYMGA